MRWSPPPDAVARADAQPWDGPLARAMRPLTFQNLVRNAFTAVIMFGLGGTAAFVAAALPPPRAHPGFLVAVGSASLAVSLGTLTLLLTLSPPRLRHIGAFAGVTTLFFSIVLVTGGVLAAGPEGQAIAVLYCEAPIFAVYMFRRPWAIAVVVGSAVGYGVTTIVQHLGAAGWTNWYVVVTTLLCTGVLVGVMAKRSEELSLSERAARTELAEVNATLERRVAEQVDELERFGRLRRFLSPQIADAVLSDGAQGIFEPHRRRIAVFFCDLRGFTAFTNAAEPEEVVQVLDDYYQAVGHLLNEHHATIGGYAGDGVMAYFGDPVPTERPARDAVVMAVALTRVLDELVATWKRRGHQLGYGMAITYGYATLGVVGFDTRHDYTPLGAVVNLAARLCAKAQHGELLVDLATHGETENELAYRERPSSEMKGFGPDVRIFAWERPRDVRSVSTPA